jgi:hypothetical protein
MSLRRNAAICELAVAIFKARGESYGGATVLTEQPPHVRHQYVTRADEVLKTLQPGRVLARQFVTGLRTAESNVVGFITSEPIA